MPPSPAIEDVSVCPPSPPSPTASFYDMSDDEEGEYSTIRHSKTGKGVKLLYTKSKVYIHPTPSTKDNIPGYIALLQQKPAPDAEVTSPTSPGSSRDAMRERNSLLLAWVPESSLGSASEIYTKVDLSESDSPPKQSFLVPPPPVTTTSASSLGSYAFAIPLSHIYSLLVRPPSVGWWFGSLIINTRAGDSCPALFFHDSECQSTIQQRKKLQRETFDIGSAHGGGMFWGGDEVLKWMKRYVTVERSMQEPSVYLVDPSEADQVGFGAGGRPTPDKVRNVLEGKGKDDKSTSRKKSDAQMDPVVQALKSARWNFLEKMAQVTTFTRRTAQAVAENKNVPPQVRRLMQNPQVQTVSDEFDSARLYLARWAMGIAEQSEKERNQRIWTAKDVLEMEESEVGQFEILDAKSLSLADKRKPVTIGEWNGFFNSRTGSLETTPDEIKDRIFHGGLDENDGVRKEAWLFLLGVYDWDSTREERHAKINSLRDEFIRLKGAWWERMVDEQGTLEEREWWKEQKFRIEKDVHRTDRHIQLFAGEDIPHPDPDSPFAEAGTNVHLEQMKDMLLTYNEYNRDLGYVQGMSDLLAPIYAVEQDDAIAFWGFVGFMERMERNFLRDQSGMRLQLMTLDQLCQLLDPKLYEHLQRLDSTNFFFFFRMLLVWFKREFVFGDILRLWEGLWTDLLSSNFHLFIAMAILDKHRNVIIDHLKGFDEVLKYVNELSGTIDLPSTMVRAEALFRRFQRVVEAIDKKSNFPVPSARLRAPAATVTIPASDGRPRLSSRSSQSSSTDNSQAEAQRKQNNVRTVMRSGPVRQTSNSTNPTRPESSTSTSSRAQSSGTASGRDGASTSGRDNAAGENAAAGAAMERERVVSTELRALLSREVPKLKKVEVIEHGGGVGS